MEKAWKWMDQLKQQSEQVVNVYKRDLTEFVQTVQEETKAASQKVETLIKPKQVIDDCKQQPQQGEETIEQTDVSHPISKQVEQTADFLARKTEGILSGITQLLKNPITITEPSTKNQLVDSFQLDPATYLNNPISSDYDSFQQQFHLHDYQSKRQEILQNDQVRLFIESIIPSKVSEQEGWCRLFFRMQQTERPLKSRETLLLVETCKEEEEFKWDTESEAEEPNKPSGDIEASKNESITSSEKEDHPIDNQIDLPIVEKVSMEQNSEVKDSDGWDEWESTD